MRGSSSRLRLWCLAACIWMTAFAQVSSGRRRVLNTPWVPPETTRRNVNKLAWSQASAGRTVMQCLGARLITRACYFENVYYDISSGHFVYFGPKGSTSAAFGEAKSGEPWLKLIRGVVRWRDEGELDNQFFMDWQVDDPLPPEAEVVDFEQPLHLHGPYHPKSIGHLLRDNLQYLIDLPLRFGRDPVSFDWVRWSSAMAWSEWEEETATAEHYRGLYNNRPSRLWQDVLGEALAWKPDGIKYIRFRELIAGTGTADVATHMGTLGKQPSSTTLSSWAHYCHPFPFAEMREVAYRNLGMEVASAPALEPFVLFMDGQPHERRHMPNAGELIPNLQRTFPGVRMEHVEISVHPLEEQMELLSKATVVVTNIGSRSFRLIYLSNGASVILVGPPEFKFDAAQSKADKLKGAPVVQAQVKMPFQEIEWCWGYIGYVNMLQYHVTSKAEVPAGRVQRWKTWKDARNDDIVLDEAKLTGLLQVALHKPSHGRSHRGAGTLAAYK